MLVDFARVVVFAGKTYFLFSDHLCKPDAIQSAEMAGQKGYVYIRVVPSTMGHAVFVRRKRKTAIRVRVDQCMNCCRYFHNLLGKDKDFAEAYSIECTKGHSLSVMELCDDFEDTE